MPYPSASKKIIHIEFVNTYQSPTIIIYVKIVNTKVAPLLDPCSQNQSNRTIKQTKPYS